MKFKFKNTNRPIVVLLQNLCIYLIIEVHNKTGEKTINNLIFLHNNILLLIIESEIGVGDTSTYQ